MRSERQALADIAVECQKARREADRRGRVTPYWVRTVEPIIADVQPEPAPVRGTIDRDAIERVLRKVSSANVDENWVWNATNAILALVRPVEGVVLTREDRDRVTGWFVQLGEPPTEVQDADRALFQRLEAAS